MAKEKPTKDKHASLSTAKKAKNDEFYTRFEDVMFEINYYKTHFKGKHVYCNCDDCFNSNFFAYFALAFGMLNLKALTATCYADSKLAYSFSAYPKIEQIIREKASAKGKNFGVDKIAYKITITQPIEDVDGDGKIVFNDVIETVIANPDVLEILDGNGSYDSPECIDILKGCDIVVTNPPFSLFREYVATLIKHKKKFIIWGNNNAITYKEVFPYIKQNKMWIGYTCNKTCLFKVPDSYKYDEKATATIGDGNHYGKVPAITVFTNVPHKKRNEELILKDRYVGHEDEYPKYDNYDAINIDKVALIPNDYDGVMGVPITFLGVYNPKQFDIIGMLNVGCFMDSKGWQGSNGKNMLQIGETTAYKRILIQKK